MHQQTQHSLVGGVAGEFLAIDSSHLQSDMGSATDAACTLIEKREGSVVLDLSEYTSVEIWVNEAEGLAAVTLGSGYPRKGAESIKFYAMGNFVSKDILIEEASGWALATSAIQLMTHCKKT